MNDTVARHHGHRTLLRNLPSPVIDTHCHLTFPDYQEDRIPGGVAAVLSEAATHGVSGVITISTTVPDAIAAVAVAARFPNVWCAAGVHPLYADQGPHDWAQMKFVGQHPKCVAWGELGLDNHYPEPSKAVQVAVLEEQLASLESWAAAGLSKPVVLHCREAFDDLIPILRKSSLEARRFVFHCFTGSVADIRKVLDFGASVSFTGVVTYRNAAEVRDAARLAPPDRIMVETDGPFLSPDPHRGTRPCRPWMASLVAKKLAEIRGESWDAFHAQLNSNTRAFFGVG